MSKRKALEDYKLKLLRDLKQYERTIEEFHKNDKNRAKCILQDSSSSDSEDDVPMNVDRSSVKELRHQHSMMMTYLQATQELTSLQVLQSEVNVMVNDPELNGERPVKEEGTWYEVTADCRVDLVPFNITFYAHKPRRRYGPTSYRNLQVVLVKVAHEKELEKSILSTLNLPGDAVEVIRSYAAAHRSRRETLAKLAETYGSALHMETLPNGGFLLKCAGLLQLSWILQNNKSKLAPFFHCFNFELEYIDEKYINIISRANRRLADPTLETDERTEQLSIILRTVQEVQGLNQDVDDTTESETEAAKVPKRSLAAHDQEVPMKKRRDEEVMAPPKSLPKKSKTGKENFNNNAGKYRGKPANEPTDIAKAKNVNKNTNDQKEGNKVNDADMANTDENQNSNKKPEENRVDLGKNKDVDGKAQQSKNKAAVKDKVSEKNITENVKDSNKVLKNIKPKTQKVNSAPENQTENATTAISTDKGETNVEKPTELKEAEVNTANVKNKVMEEKAVSKKNENQTNPDKIESNNASNKTNNQNKDSNKPSNAKKIGNADKGANPDKMKPKNVAQKTNIQNKVANKMSNAKNSPNIVSVKANDGEINVANKNVQNNVASSKPKDKLLDRVDKRNDNKVQGSKSNENVATQQKVVTKQKDGHVKNSAVTKNRENNTKTVASVKNTTADKNIASAGPQVNTNLNAAGKRIEKFKLINPYTTGANTKIPLKTQNKMGVQNAKAGNFNSKIKTGNTKPLVNKISKIPQKLTSAKGVWNKEPIRMSPRMLKKQLPEPVT